MSNFKFSIAWFTSNIKIVLLILLPALTPTILINSYLTQKYIVEKSQDFFINVYPMFGAEVCMIIVDIIFAMFWIGALLYYLSLHQQTKVTYGGIIVGGLRSLTKLSIIAIIIWIVSWGILSLTLIGLPDLHTIGQLWACFIYFIVAWRYALILPVGAIEKLGIIDSFERSAILSKGARIQMFLIILGIILLNYVIMIGVVSLVADLAIALALGDIWVTLISKTFEYFINWLILSILVVTLYFYYDERISKLQG